MRTIDGQLCVLIADDHQVMREGLRALLKSKDIDFVREATSGREAVEKAGEYQPDVVIMDITMPDLNGVDASRAIKDACPNTAIIAFSGRTDGRTVRAALEAGVSGFVPKEAAFDELVKAIDACLEGKVYLSPSASGCVADMMRDNGSSQPAMRRLTPREREVLQMTAEGMAMKQIARQLSLSVKTIETHRRQIMEKLSLYSVAELTRYAIREGMTPN